MKKKWYASTQFSGILLKNPLSSKLLMSDLLWCNFHRYIWINSHAFSGLNIYYQIHIIFFYIYMLFFSPKYFHIYALKSLFLSFLGRSRCEKISRIFTLCGSAVLGVSCRCICQAVENV